MKVTVDRDLCIGAASCVALLPEVFELDEEGKAFVREGTEKLYLDGAITFEQIVVAAQSCPVNAIAVWDDDGNQVYP